MLDLAPSLSRSPLDIAFYSRTQLADHILARDLVAHTTRECGDMAIAIADLAEFDHRKSYLAAGYPSMVAYCQGVLGQTRAEALKRIDVARTARRFPAIFPMLADRRLNLTTVLLLSPYLNENTAVELLAAAAGKSCSAIELFLAERFPKPDVDCRVQGVSDSPVMELSCQVAARRLGMTTSQHPAPDDGAKALPGKVAPLSPGRFAVQFTLSQDEHEDLCCAQALLGHANTSGGIAKVFARALRTLVEQLERRKFAACSRSRPGKRRRTAGGRYVPAAVKREVWVRDGGQCTFVSEGGHRCEARASMEFDHVLAVARGGTSTVANVRLRCAPHNQFEAEKVFGKGFMDDKRQAAQERAADARARKSAVAEEAAQAKDTAAKVAREVKEAADKAAREAKEAKQAAQAREAAEARGRAAAEAARAAREEEIAPALRRMGFRRDEVRYAAALCEAMPDAPLEKRVLYALKCLAPASSRRPATVAGSPG